jgi:hypothetical protein
MEAYSTTGFAFLYISERYNQPASKSSSGHDVPVILNCLTRVFCELHASGHMQIMIERLLRWWALSFMKDGAPVVIDRSTSKAISLGYSGF